MISNLSVEAVDEAWQTISDLRLRLHQSVFFYQHQYRGVAWLIIADQQEECYFRCSIHAEKFLRLLDGSRTVEQAFSEAQKTSPLNIQQQDIVLLIANLKTSALLQDESAGASQAQSIKQKANPWLRPFSIKFDLFNPDKFLQKTLPYVKPLFSHSAFLIWLMVICVALITALLNWSELLEHSEARFSDPQNLIWYWLLYPLIKALHEMGHAYSTKVWGGRVQEMGIMLLVFFPVPYVNSSAAHRFDSKNRRLLVNAAGIMVELLLASVALLLWVNTEPGMLHDMAFDIVVIGGVSTLIFNANPLLKFDGYYMLGELIEIPNLGTRSNQYLAYLFKHYVLGIAGIRSPVSATGEVKWLVIYGIFSNIYRVFISLFIAFWVAGKFFIIGMLLALWAIGSQIIFPAAKQLYALIPVVINAQRQKRFALVASVALLFIMSVLLIPVGHSTYSEGIVSLSENALIRAGTDGIVSRVLLQDGDDVEQGMTIFELENIELSTRREILIARLEEARARQNEVFLQDRTQADILKSRVASIKAEFDDIQLQLKNLQVISSTGGVISLPLSSDLAGRFVSRGEVMGYVVEQNQLTARVVVPQLNIDAVRKNTASIEVRLRSRPGESMQAEFLRELPLATDKLPNRLLGSGGGGEVAVDARDESGVQVMSNIFQVEISLPLNTAGNFLGQRIYVRFIHQRESLAKQWLRQLKHFMLQTPFA